MPSLRAAIAGSRSWVSTQANPPLLVISIHCLIDCLVAALGALQSSLTLPHQPKLRTLLGEAQAELGMVKEAVVSLQRAAKDDEELSAGSDEARDFHTLDQLGVALYLAGQAAEAEAAFSLAVEASPELASGHAKLGST